MNEEKMKRVIEAVTQCKPLAKNDWPRGREEWGWLLDRTCDLHSIYTSSENETLKKAVKIVVEEFFDFVDKVYPEGEESIPDKKIVGDDEDEETEKRDMERTMNLMMTIVEFTCHCEEEYLIQMPDKELKAWKALARTDKQHRIQLCPGYKFGKIANGFMIDDTVENLIQERKDVEEAREHKIPYLFERYV